jgi:lipoprotein-anchoring transpeptidase ErfK/SrfK
VRRLAAIAAVLLTTLARGDTRLPPWSEPSDLPVPSWAQSVAPKRAEVPILKTPGDTDDKRGTTLAGARLPLYGMKRGQKCGGRYLLVGPEAWICSDAADLSPEPRFAAPLSVGADGLPYRYYFVGKAGASGFIDLSRAQDAAPDEDLDPGFAVAVVEQRTAHGEAWGRTHHGPWVALRELGAARPSGFHGVESKDLSFAWVLPDRAAAYSAPNPGARTTVTHVRYQVVPWREEKTTFVRISEDGETPTRWMSRKDLAHPSVVAPPSGLLATERWIDIELASQTLVAYEGTTPVFSTLVSTGRGPKGTDTATPPGLHRIWVKLTSSTMDNLPPPNEDAASPPNDAPLERYSIEDVPYVQFFDGAVALHGAFWHDSFGKLKSHGCVNLAPLDAARLFAFTAPHLPAGWSAVLPTAAEPGTLVRVR